MKSVNLSELVTKVVNLFDDILKTQTKGNYFCIMSTKSYSDHLLHAILIKNIVQLSDLFSTAQYEWALTLFTKLFDANDQTDDFVIKSHLVLGICKVYSCQNVTY